MTTLIRLPQLQQRLPLSRSTIYQMIADGQLPASIPLSRRCVAWPEDEIDQWSAAVAAGATTKQLTALVEQCAQARDIRSPMLLSPTEEHDEQRASITANSR